MEMFSNQTEDFKVYIPEHHLLCLYTDEDKYSYIQKNKYEQYFIQDQRKIETMAACF